MQHELFLCKHRRWWLWGGRRVCLDHVDVAFVAELIGEGAKSISRAHPHLLGEQPFGTGQEGVVPLQEMQLTQLCAMGWCWMRSVREFAM